MATDTQERDEAGRFLTGYSPELADKICAEMIDGRSVRSICNDEGMPTKRTVMYWLRKYPEFKEIYKLAQQERAEGYIEEIVDIADDTSGDYTIDIDSGAVRVDHENIQRSRLRVDTRKWIAAKMHPSRYGEKVELSGPNGGAIPHAVEFHIVDHRPADKPSEG